MNPSTTQKYIVFMTDDLYMRGNETGGGGPPFVRPARLM